VGEALSRRFQIDPRRVSTIYNAVDLATVSTRAEELPPDLPAQPFIVSAGRLVHQKGFDLLIPAFARIISDRNVSLVILGEGPERAALEALARTHGVERRVFFPGFVDNPWSYFARAAAFVCASRWEGFGNVIIEAMACGVPVVATDCDFGPREIVRHGDSGVLVAVENVPAIGAALASILDDRGWSARLADGARRRAADFDVPQMTRTYEHMFRELTEGRPKRRPLQEHRHQL
jgi:glycosyltransferase involved in cell wall biosynthesis